MKLTDTKQVLGDSVRCQIILTMPNRGEFMYTRRRLSLTNTASTADEIYGILGTKSRLKRSHGLKICAKEPVVSILTTDCRKRPFQMRCERRVWPSCSTRT